MITASGGLVTVIGHQIIISLRLSIRISSLKPLILSTSECDDSSLKPDQVF